MQLYGAVSPAQLADAEVLLAHIDTPPSEPGPRLDAAAFARRAEAELDHYRGVEPDLAVGVEVRDDSSGVMVVNGNVLIAPTVSVPARRADALLQHEIGTHVVTHVNGSRQPLRLLGAGLAGYDETQEGLAVFAEYLVGGLTGRRLRQLAARVVAVHQMTEGAAFSEVHRNLVDSGVVTSRGVHDHHARVPIGRADQGRRLPPRVGRRHRPPRRRRSARRAVARARCRSPTSPTSRICATGASSHEPLLVPRYLAEPDVQQRLAGITTSTTALDMIGATG